MTAIEWTDTVWNPTTGCDRVSPGCDHCYAMTMAKRLKGMGQAKYQTDGDPRTSGPGFGLAIHPDVLDLPLRWRKPRRVFVNSMSDLFHDRVSDEYIARVFVVMAAAKQHTFQVLTKRHGRIRSLLSSPRFQVLAGSAAFDFMQEHKRTVGWSWPLPNVWLGVSVEDQQWAGIRIPALVRTPAAVRFLSCEPLLGPINLNPWLWEDCPSECVSAGHALEVHRMRTGNLDWVITGGESGPNFRPTDPEWFQQIRDQCVEAGVAYLHKQNGGIRPKANGRELDGRTWDQYPEHQ